MQHIHIKGARTHNLQNIDLSIPRDKLVVITGISGSGKSSLAFDTLYAEGQRRYVESLSTYARQFLSLMGKPDVDSIEGLSPAISIEQKSTSHNPRSTVGTITEIYDYLRLLFARIGEPHCPDHGLQLKPQTITQMIASIGELEQNSRWMLIAPAVRERKGEYLHLIAELRAQGFVRLRVNGEVKDIDRIPKLDKNKKNTIEVVVDRFKVGKDMRLRLAESLELALKVGDGLASVEPYIADGESAQPQQHKLVLSSRYTCPECGYGLAELEPRMFSFNSPVGACQACDGIGVRQVFDHELIIRDPSLALNEGVIKGWEPRNHWSYQMIRTVAEHYDIALDAPWQELDDESKNVLLYGSGEHKLHFSYTNDKGFSYSTTHAFEGVIPNLERRYRETSSASVRDELGKLITQKQCDVCHGQRLALGPRNVFIQNKNLPAITALSIADTLEFFRSIQLSEKEQIISSKILSEINNRLGFLVNVGLDYLTLHRNADTLSGGEAQRIRLASQIGSGLMGVLYVLDEPSIGLHQRDNERLLETLYRIRDLGNTVIVVEHDEEAIRAADHLIDIGPGAGVHGGRVVAQGTPEQVMRNPESRTGLYLTGELKVGPPANRIAYNSEQLLCVSGACGNNLKHIDVDIPLGLFTCITGVSGSGKSTLINHTLYPALARQLHRAHTLKPMAHTAITGLEHIDKVIDVDQSPIGRTPRSNPATYTGIFTPIRELFAGTKEARSRGYKPGRFSFNVKGGRCDACEGDGVIKVEMHFLPDVYVKCDVCNGKRYKNETLDITYKGKNIAQVLDMTVEEACSFFSSIPQLQTKLATLMEVGLGYITLGQRATTLSGGEAQRIKLARELARRDTGHTLYILDEPTTGLHFHDIDLLLHVFFRLRDRGNSIVIIEHNLDVIRAADWLIDIGPEGGKGGGEVIATGTPEQVAQVQQSHTGRFLQKLLTASQHADSIKQRVPA